MHILATDFLTCPRCGPQFGLIVLADEVKDRQVLEGRLGCANCRSSFEIRDGTADLRLPSVPSPPLAASGRSAARAVAEDQALRVAALIGARAPGTNVLLIAAEDLAPEVARQLRDAHVVGGYAAAPEIRGELLPPADGTGSITRVLHGQRLPFRSGAFAAAAVVGAPASDLLPEIRRVLAPGARLVLEGATDLAVGALREGGFRVDLAEDSTVVAAVPGPR